MLWIYIFRQQRTPLKNLNEYCVCYFKPVSYLVVPTHDVNMRFEMHTNMSLSLEMVETNSYLLMMLIRWRNAGPLGALGGVKGLNPPINAPSIGPKGVDGFLSESTWSPIDPWHLVSAGVGFDIPFWCKFILYFLGEGGCLRLRLGWRISILIGISSMSRLQYVVSWLSCPVKTTN